MIFYVLHSSESPVLGGFERGLLLLNLIPQFSRNQITLTHPPHNPPFTVLHAVSVIPVFLNARILFILA